MQKALLFDLDARSAPGFEDTLRALGAIPAVFWQSLEAGAAEMREYFDRYKSAPEPHVREMLVRYQAKRFLEERRFRVDEEEDVHVGDEPLAALALKVGPVSFRILKGKDGVLPGCGRSRARRGFYSQQPQRYLAQDRSVTDTRLNLVVLWDFDQQFGISGLWLVCPRRAGERSRDVDCFWIGPIPNPTDQVVEYDPHGGPEAFESVGDDLEALLRNLDADDTSEERSEAKA